MVQNSFAIALTNLIKTIIEYFTQLWTYLTYPLFTITIPNWAEEFLDIFTVVNISIQGTYDVNFLFIITTFIPIAILLKLISMIPFIE